VSTRGTYRIGSNSALLAVLLLATLFASGCGLGSKSGPECSGGNQPYKDTCLIITSAGGSFKAVADASLSVAYNEAKQENTCGTGDRQDLLGTREALRKCYQRP
jgi:hypothetical protein